MSSECVVLADHECSAILKNIAPLHYGGLDKQLQSLAIASIGYITPAGGIDEDRILLIIDFFCWLKAAVLVGRPLVVREPVN